MSILTRIFRGNDALQPSSLEPQPVVCERLERRRCDARQAWHDEHLFGYIDADGNVSNTPASPRA